MQFFLWILLMLTDAFVISAPTIEILAGLVVCTKVLEIFYNPSGMLHQVRDAMVMLTELDHDVKKPPQKVKDQDKYHDIMKEIKRKMLHVHDAGHKHPSYAAE